MDSKQNNVARPSVAKKTATIHRPKKSKIYHTSSEVNELSSHTKRKRSPPGPRVPDSSNYQGPSTQESSSRSTRDVVGMREALYNKTDPNPPQQAMEALNSLASTACPILLPNEQPPAPSLPSHDSTDPEASNKNLVAGKKTVLP